MAEKAIVRYLYDRQGMVWEEETIKAKEGINIGPHHQCDDLILIDGDIKAIYVHRADLIAIVIDKTD